MSIHLILACHLESHLLNWQPHPATAAGAEAQVAKWEETDCAQGRRGRVAGEETSLQAPLVLGAGPTGPNHLDTLPTSPGPRTRGLPVPEAQAWGPRQWPPAKQS